MTELLARDGYGRPVTGIPPAARPGPGEVMGHDAFLEFLERQTSSRAIRVLEL